MDKSIFENLKKKWLEVVISDSENEVVTEYDLDKKVTNLLQVSDSFYYIFHLPTGTIKYISPSVTYILGYSTEDITLEELISYIHPDDLPFYLDCQNTITSFLSQLPPNKLQKYKTRYDYRIRNKKGEYLRILHQGTIIESGINGGSINGLVVNTDITHLKKDLKSIMSIIGLDGEPSYYDILILKNNYLKKIDLLSKREKEVLSHIMNGKNSYEIAELLFISKYTVDTHRKNILNKTGCNSIGELTTKSLSEGWV